MKPEDVVGDICGFLVVIVAVILLNAFKDLDISLEDVRGIMKPKRRLNGSSRNNSHQFEESLITRHDSKEFKTGYGTSSSSSDERV
jgi:hypothetical protein